MTCSAAHRQAWNRLKKRVTNDYDKLGQGMTRPADAAQTAAGADPVELAIEVFKQELTPHVRDAITDDVVKAVRALVTLTPQLVESLGKDLFNTDPVARGRAQALIAKYTLGAFDQEKNDATKPLHIHLGNMPVPGEQIPDTIAPSTTLMECERCEEMKTLEHFEPGAPRCNECQAEIKAAIQAQYE